MEIKILAISVILVLVSSSITNALVYLPDFGYGSGQKQPFPPGWYVRLIIENCVPCDVGVVLPNGTLAYIVQNYIPTTCFPNNGGCYIDYLTPDMEGRYELRDCGSGYDCPPPAGQPGNGYFYVKRMPILEETKEDISNIKMKLRQIIMKIGCLIAGTGLTC